MAEPIPFPVAVKLPRAPCPMVVNLARNLLTQAESGELQGLAVGTVYADDLVPAGSINSGWANARGTYHAMSAAVGKLQRAWGRWCDNIPEEAASTPPGPGAA